MAEPNWTENQRIWDEGDPSLEMCRHKGAEHGAYGWGCNPPPRLSRAQQAAYVEGFIASVTPTTPSNDAYLATKLAALKDPL